MEQIEAMLADDPDDSFLRYGLAMEHASGGDDESAIVVIRELIERTSSQPYIPAFLQGGQILMRLDRTDAAVSLLREGIVAAAQVDTADALHARGEMLGLLASIE